jgi:hypothetical protein
MVGIALGTLEKLIPTLRVTVKLEMVECHGQTLSNCSRDAIVARQGDTSEAGRQESDQVADFKREPSFFSTRQSLQIRKVVLQDEVMVDAATSFRGRDAVIIWLQRRVEECPPIIGEFEL